MEKQKKTKLDIKALLETLNKIFLIQVRKTLLLTKKNTNCPKFPQIAFLQNFIKKKSKTNWSRWGFLAKVDLKLFH